MAKKAKHNAVVWVSGILIGFAGEWLTGFVEQMVPLPRTAACYLTGSECPLDKRPLWERLPEQLSGAVPVRCAEGNCALSETIGGDSRVGATHWFYLDSAETAYIHLCDKDIVGKPYFRIYVVDPYSGAGPLCYSGFSNESAETISLQATQASFYGIWVEAHAQGDTKATCEPYDDSASFREQQYCLNISTSP